MCTVLLTPGVYPIAVKYIISYTLLVMLIQMFFTVYSVSLDKHSDSIFKNPRLLGALRTIARSDY